MGATKRIRQQPSRIAAPAHSSSTTAPAFSPPTSCWDANGEPTLPYEPPLPQHHQIVAPRRLPRPVLSRLHGARSCTGGALQAASHGYPRGNLSSNLERQKRTVSLSGSSQGAVE